MIIIQKYHMIIYTKHKAPANNAVLIRILFNCSQSPYILYCSYMTDVLNNL